MFIYIYTLRYVQACATKKQRQVSIDIVLKLQLHPGSPTIHSKDHGVQHRAAHILSQEFCELCHSGIIRTQLIYEPRKKKLITLEYTGGL